MLSQLFQNDISTLGIGKISDLFGEEYLNKSIHTEGDENGMQILLDNYKSADFDFYFINLVDLDMLYGHREDAQGYVGVLPIRIKHLVILTSVDTK